MKESKWNVFLDVRLKTHLLDYNVLIIRMFY